MIELNVVRSWFNHSLRILKLGEQELPKDLLLSMRDTVLGAGDYKVVILIDSAAWTTLIKHNMCTKNLKFILDPTLVQHGQLGTLFDMDLVTDGYEEQNNRFLDPKTLTVVSYDHRQNFIHGISVILL